MKIRMHEQMRPISEFADRYVRAMRVRHYFEDKKKAEKIRERDRSKRTYI